MLGISARTLRLAVERGEIDAAHPLPDGPWVFQPAPLWKQQRLPRWSLGFGAAHHEAAIPDAQQATLGFSGLSGT